MCAGCSQLRSLACVGAGSSQRVRRASGATALEEVKTTAPPAFLHHAHVVSGQVFAVAHRHGCVQAAVFARY